jgi:hypothetical protein
VEPIEDSLPGSLPDARGTQTARAVHRADRGTQAARGTPRGRGRGRGPGQRGASRGGSLSQPPPPLRQMDELEDEDFDFPRASKVFRSTAYGNQVPSLAVLWIKIAFPWKISVLFAVLWKRMSVL